MTVRIINGDCIDVLKTLPDQSVHCCVTSPPYWGLRDYGVAGQLGLESTPQKYVEKMVSVFREVRRVLRNKGTLWLNLGDSYANDTKWGGSTGGKHVTALHNTNVGRGKRNTGLKAKDLVGIPWRVAFALQQPYYTGSVKDERDRVWLAAMLDAEGSICGTEYQTSDRTKTNLFISITNTSVPIIDKCERLFPQEVKHVYEKSGPSSRACYRWDVERMDTKALFIREIYPYLVAKRKQAILGYTFLDMQRGLESKKKGYLAEQHEQRSWLMAALSKLNAGEDVDLPDWAIEPPSLFEPGFYLRQDIIWAKPNPMPESVRDRCTKSHEYLFLLAKSERYYFDSEAIQEPAGDDLRRPFAPGQVDARGNGHDRGGGSMRKSGNKERKPASARGVPVDTDGKSAGAVAGSVPWEGNTRNKRSVWTVATQPFKEAHFATFPPALIEPCILAGCPVGGKVLDPFGGAGTTGLVSDRLQRDAVLIELNPEYATMAENRIHADGPLFSSVTA